MNKVKIEKLEEVAEVEMEELEQIRGGATGKSAATFKSLVYESDLKGDDKEADKSDSFVADAPPDR